jgi:predicted DNA-binding protein
MIMRTEKLVRTTIALPLSLKEKMNESNENWSQVIREMIRQRIEEEGQTDMAEAVILNERVKRPAPKDWSSLQVIKQWRRRTNT